MKDTVIKNWKKTIKKLQVDNQIPEVSYKTWIKPLEVIKVEDDVVYISVPLEAQREYVEKKYLQSLKVCIAEVTGQKYDVKLITNEEDVTECISHNGNNKTDVKEEIVLNPQYTFETFVIGKSNNFAHAVSVAIAETPCEIYNPLVLYGENGSGKTHLMQAIAHYIMKKHADKKVLYATGNSFAKDLSEAIKCDVENSTQFTMTMFRDKYQNVDVLLVDDIQPIIRNEILQEEFYRLFNHLHSQGKHVIVSSDKALKDIEGLQIRLRTCLEWGIVADISLPDEETKKAILRRQEESQ